MTDKQPIYAELPADSIGPFDVTQNEAGQDCYDHMDETWNDAKRWGVRLYTAEQMRAFADATHALRAALAAQAPQHGYVLVPVEPTEAMVSAGYDAFGVNDCYASMLAAAPKAPQQAAPAAEWLEQAYREGWAACRDAETIGEEAEDWAFGNSTANSRMIDMQQAAPQQEVQEPVVAAVFDEQLGRPVIVEGAPMLKHGQLLYTAQPAPSGDAWKDGDTAALVNELRDAAVQYRDTQQLRDRIAHIVRPLAARVAPSGDAARNYERRYAIRQGRGYAACDAYFASRHEIAGVGLRMVFRDGFERGWDAALAASHVQKPTGNGHIAGDVSKSGQESNMSDAEDAARALFDAGWKACARFCDREDAIFDGIVGNTGCPEFEAAFNAARKDGK